jgi:hypothetical protein
MVLSAASTLQPSTSANEDNPHLLEKQVFNGAQGIIGEFEKAIKPNSNVISTPLTTTLRNLGMRFCLRGEEL